MDFFPKELGSKLPETAVGIIELFKPSQPFNADVWIGQGKKYPQNPIDVDSSVCNYCEDLHKIPDSFTQECLPTHSLSIKCFLEFTIPPVNEGLGNIHTSHCFSH
jgi:hypothetical protein